MTYCGVQPPESSAIPFRGPRHVDIVHRIHPARYSIPHRKRSVKRIKPGPSSYLLRSGVKDFQTIGIYYAQSVFDLLLILAETSVGELIFFLFPP